MGYVGIGSATVEKIVEEKINICKRQCNKKMIKRMIYERIPD